MTAQRDTIAQRPVEELLVTLTELTEEPLDEPLLVRALTHRSYSYENGGVPHNERMELLGDSVLGLVVTDHLFRTHGDLSEGELAKLRAAVVNMHALAEVSRTIDLGHFVRLGKGEEGTGGREKESILADTLEAVIGCTYLSSPHPRGFDAAGRLVHALLGPVMRRSATLGAALDWKTSLQEVAAKIGEGVVRYHVEASGPDHEKVFAATVVVDGVERGSGSGRTKKVAEQQAAEGAYQLLAAQLEQS
ncbi:ribonuclease III [Marihabitans asiaticum]|uniref:Ribonuclease 3 n=1 Tax=Marihabitans asiaticum TaxID=415218 RepID=A0A560W9J7_9MICO|nr:ribonuclease III [Marihabitans asiaticum]TWD14306.1 RNAse III [Marihabitans asiaticum]